MASLLIPSPYLPLAAADLPAPPPTQDDLPCDDGVPMETLHFLSERQIGFTDLRICSSRKPGS
jgi:hypothetical protein